MMRISWFFVKTYKPHMHSGLFTFQGLLEFCMKQQAEGKLPQCVSCIMQEARAEGNMQPRP